MAWEIRLAGGSAAVTILMISATASGQPTPAQLGNDPTLFLESARKRLKWDEPAEPTHIVGPIHFAGTQGLGCYLITGSQGHIVLNSGMPGSGPLIEASIRKLGFKLTDVKLLLACHAHVDHVGGHAHLQKVTGAKVAMLREEAELMASGGQNDFHYGTQKAFRFDPTKVDSVFRDGDDIKLGDITIKAHRTAGHTRGSATYVMKVKEADATYTVAFPDGTSVNPGYRVTEKPSYPGIADDFRATFRTLESLKPDIWLTGHTDVFAFGAKRSRTAKDGAKAWVDPEGYKKWVALQKGKFEAAVK